MAPSVIAVPYLIDAETNKITIGWTEPLKNGGCPLTGYSLYRDDGNEGPVSVEVNSSNDPAIRDNPVLSQVIVTNFGTGTEGKYFRFKVRAHNREGYVDTTFLRVLNAGRPLAPQSAPVLLTQSATDLSV